MKTSKNYYKYKVGDIILSKDINFPGIFIICIILDKKFTTVQHKCYPIDFLAKQTCIVESIYFHEGLFSFYNWIRDQKTYKVSTL